MIALSVGYSGLFRNTLTKQAGIADFLYISKQIEQCLNRYINIKCKLFISEA